MPNPFDVSGGGDYSDSAYGGVSSSKNRKKTSPDDLYSPGIGIGDYAGFNPTRQRQTSSATPSAYQSSVSPGRRNLTNPYNPSAPLRSFAEPVDIRQSSASPVAATPASVYSYPDMMPNLSPVGRTISNPLVPGPTAPSLADTSLYANPEARFPIGSVPAAPIGWENPFYPGAGIPTGRSGRGAGGR